MAERPTSASDGHNHDTNTFDPWEAAEAEREYDEAHERGYRIGLAEGRDEAETRDLSFDGLTDRAKKAEAEVQRLREGIKALADEYDADATQEGYGGELWTTTARRVRALLDGAR